MSTPIAYRPDIDGLRAVAVCAVVIFHAFPSYLPGGFVGVDVFFVISGFLITSILQKSFVTGRFSLFDFYARRIRRIFPALALVITACLLAGWFLLLPGELATLGKHAAAGAGFVANLVLWQESGYFEQGASRTILLHLWSLGIEEQFYLLWPLLMLVSWKLRIRPIWTAAVICAISFALNLAIITADPVAAFYNPLTRAWELGIGALLALGAPRVGPSARTSAFLSLAGVAALVASMLMLSEADPFPGWRAAIPALGAAAVIAAGPTDLFNRLLGTGMPVYLGKISYPLYLWHWPLLAFPAIILDGAVDDLWKAVAMAVALALSVATFHLLERPFSGERSLIGKAGVLAVAMSLVAAMGLGAFSTAGLPTRSNMAEYVDTQAWLAARLDWPYAENDRCLERFPSSHRRQGWWFCVLEGDGPPTVFLIGNSFANHLYPGLLDAPGLEDENVLQFGSCDPGMGLSFTYTPSHPCFGEGRVAQEEMTSRIIEENPSIRLAILNAPWPSFDAEGNAVDYFDPTKIDGVFNSRPPVAGETSYDAFMGALERRIAFLADRDIVTVIVLTTPWTGYSAETCYGGRPLVSSANSCSVSLNEELRRQRRFREGVDQIASRYPDLLVFDPLPVLCQNGICTMKNASGPLLRDLGHLSVEGSSVVGSAIGQWLSNQEGTRR